MQGKSEGLFSAIQGSQMLRLLLVVFLAVLLQIPISMIGHLVSERQQRRAAAVTEVTSKWGTAQKITGPALVVPHFYRWKEDVERGRAITHTETRHAVFLPEKLRVRGKVESENRARGIFSVPVYRLALTLEGEFAPPDLAALEIKPADMDWKRAELSVGVSDVRAIRKQPTASWNGKPVAFLPGTSGFTGASTGIHAVVGGDAPSGPIKFSLPLSLNGSLGLYLAPFGRETVVDLVSNWESPSFQGNWLPSRRSVSKAGFDSGWVIPFLGRNYPQAWTSETDRSKEISLSLFGVELRDPVDHYRMADRSVKYAALFILLTFAAVWLVEVLAGIRVHPIQYLLLGGALCAFYLLELSLSEHMGFPIAYAIASLMVVGMVGAYNFAVFHSVPRAAVVTAGVSGLYGYLYVLLMNEDYALLIGAFGLFAVLAMIMFLTRGVDWYALGRRTRVPSAPA